MNLSDEELYLQLDERPEAAFRALYQRYSGPLLRFLYRFTGATESSEEILHDIFVQLLAKKFRPGAEGSLKSWLFTLAKNRGLNYAKKASYEKGDKSALDSAVVDTSLEVQTIERNLLAKLAFATQSLPEDLRATWSLRQQGMDYGEIAEKLTIPVGTVKSRFHRLVEYLRKELDHGP